MSKKPTKPPTCGHGAVWILGYGKFGRLAARVLRGLLGGEVPVVIVDLQPKGPVPDGAELIVADAVAWLAEHLVSASEVSCIVPALPLHLAARWLETALRREGFLVEPHPLDDDLLATLPHPFRLGPHSAVASHADFLCPDNCPEPESLCTHTGMPRPTPLYQLLADLPLVDCTPLVVTSRQFAPGVGGFFPEDLWQLFDIAKTLAPGNLLIATACKCHGVVDGLRIGKAGSSTIANWPALTSYYGTFIP